MQESRDKTQAHKRQKRFDEDIGRTFHKKNIYLHNIITMLNPSYKMQMLCYATGKENLQQESHSAQNSSGESSLSANLSSSTSVGCKSRSGTSSSITSSSNSGRSRAGNRNSGTGDNSGLSTNHSSGSGVLISLNTSTSAIEARVIAALRRRRASGVVRTTNHACSKLLVGRGNSAFGAVLALGSGIAGFSERDQRAGSGGGRSGSAEGGRCLVGEVCGRSEEAVAKAIVASVGCALGVGSAGRVELATRLDLPGSGGETVSTVRTLLGGSTLGTQRKGSGGCNDGGGWSGLNATGGSSGGASSRGRLLS